MAIFRENANLPPERPRILREIGPAEVAFGAGFLLAVVGIALVSVAAALIVAGALLMIASWRAA